MVNRKEIKLKAKEIAFQNKWNIWKPFLVIYAISILCSLVITILFSRVEGGGNIITLFSYVIEAALIPASFGYIYYIIKLINGEKIEVKEALLSKYKLFLLIISTTIIISICTTLWTLLFIIPGIIYSFKVVMASFILADTADENTSWREVISTSKKMMDGYKMDYFVFVLSFVGWIFLSIITCGIALIWAMPYIMVAQTMYYLELKKIYLTK